MTTLRDVARAAGVSAAAASYALRGDRKVSQETAERVRAVAQRLGYRRDPLQAAFATGRFRRRAELLQVAFLSHRFHELSPELARVRAALPARGFQLRVVTVARPADARAIAAFLEQEGIRLVVVGARDPELGAIAAGATAAVYWHVESLYDAPGDVVLEGHWSESVWSALRRMRGLGWRRIGIAMPAADPPHWQDAEAHAAIVEARRWIEGIELVPHLHAPAARLGERLAPWFRRHRPEALLCLTCFEPSVLRAAGCLPPFALLHTQGFDPAYRGMAGLRVDWGRMLEASIDLIELRLRQRQRDGRRIVMVEPRWLDGASLPRKT